MKWNLLFGTLVLSVGLCAQSQGATLLNRMLGSRDCGCAAPVAVNRRAARPPHAASRPAVPRIRAAARVLVRLAAIAVACWTICLRDAVARAASRPVARLPMAAAIQVAVPRIRAAASQLAVRPPVAAASPLAVPRCEIGCVLICAIGRARAAASRPVARSPMTAASQLAVRWPTAAASRPVARLPSHAAGPAEQAFPLPPESLRHVGVLRAGLRCTVLHRPRLLHQLHRLRQWRRPHLHEGSP